MVSEEATNIKSIAVQLFNEHPKENCYRECGNSYGREEHDEGNLLNVGVTTFVVHVQGIASNLTYGGEEHDEGANSHISILLLLVEDDDSHCYIIMTENRCKEVSKNCLLAINNIGQIPLQFMLYSNLEDNVLFEAWSIVVNADGP
uniref:Uncharacterized protein n=1 Tax=Solanum tuberosum TaxID=4113 RepID=M1DB80_SOLTU